MDTPATSEQLVTELLPKKGMKEENNVANSKRNKGGDEGEEQQAHETIVSDNDPLSDSPNANNTMAEGIMRSDTNTTDNTTAEPWYRNPHQLTAMLSNYSTSYNVVNISMVLPILEQLYDEDTSEDAAACASSLLAGMILGQLVGGALGDCACLGRLGALRLVMALQIVSSIASSLLFSAPGEDIYLALAVCRFILGLGAGGVYPLAAVLSAEHGKSTNSGDQVHRVVLTFSTQGLGFVTVPIVAVALLYTTTNLDLIWRLILGFGCVPGIILMLLQCALYKREHTQVPLEEPADDAEVPNTGNNVAVQTTNDTVEESDGIIRDGQDRNDTDQHHGWWKAILHEPGLGRKLIGTAGTWFLFDVVFYGNTIFQPIVVEAAFGASKSENPLHLLRETATNSLILTSIALPGYAVAGIIIGKRTGCIIQTPRYVMLQGFAAMSVLYFTIGMNWSYLRNYPALLVFLYGMTFFFANYGPNTTTFILPSLLYSPECRSTWNGISAAAGKMGALLGATFFEPAAEDWGDSDVMLVCAGLAVVALFLTHCFVPKEADNRRQVPAIA